MKTTTAMAENTEGADIIDSDFIEYPWWQMDIDLSLSLWGCAESDHLFIAFFLFAISSLALFK